MNHRTTKLYQTLEKLDAYTFNRFEKFLASPYHNSNKRLILLNSILKDEILKNKKQSKEKIYYKLYPNKTFNDQKLRLDFSDLLKLFVSFSGYETYRSNPISRANSELQGISNLKLKSLYSNSIKSITTKFNKSVLRNSNYFLEKFKLETLIFELTTEFEKKSKINKKVINYLEINRNLDYFYLIEKLKWYCSYLSWTLIGPNFQEIRYIDVILEIIESLNEDIPVELKIFHKVYKTVIDLDDSESYYELKELVFNYYQLFNSIEAKELYGSLINYCVRRANKGHIEYIAEIIEIYDIGIKNKVLLEKNHITPTAMRNIVGAALRVNKFDWTEKFIEENIHLVEEKYRQNALKFNLARIYFYKKEFEKVIETIREVEFNDNLYSNVSKTMLLASYYELEDEDALFYFADSFSIYLKRNRRLSDRVRREYLNLVKFTKKLSKARYKPSILVKLKKEIIEIKELASRKWFLEKLKELNIDES